MTVSLLDVASQTTPAQVTALLLSWLTTAGLPATAWQENSVPRALIAGESVSTADALNLVAAIANGNILDLSSGEWLTQLASNIYALDRKTPLLARGPVVLYNASGATQTHAIGTLLVRSTQTGAVYRNLEAISVLDGASGSSLWQAEEAGLSGNAAVSTVTDALTPIPGVTFNNPGSGSTWLTQIGTREESDVSLRLRCKARWPQRGLGKTLDAYAAYALSVDQVTQVRVYPNKPGQGKVKIIVAGDSNPLDVSVPAAVEALIRPLAGICVLVSADYADAFDVPIVATLYVEAAYVATAEAAAQAAILALVASKAIGEKVYRAEIVEALMSAPGAKNAVVSLPAADVTVADNGIASLLTAPVLTVTPL